MNRITAYGLFTAAWMAQLLGPTFAINDTIGVTAGTGKTANLIAFGSGNVISEAGICDATVENRCATVSAAGAVKIDGSAVTQPVSAASLPLPAGAATSALQSTINTTLGSPFQVGGSIGNTTFAATQATASNLKAQVDPLTIASWGLMSGTVPGAAPTNTGIVGGIYNSSAPTLTTGQTAPFQFDINGNAKVAVVSGGGTGGTSSTFGSAFPGTGTAIGLTNGTNMVPWSATTNYGTAPAAIAVPAVNAFITGAVGLADASTSSGQTFSKIGANAVSSAPSYTAGNTYAVTQTLGGALNVADAALLAAVNSSIPAGTNVIGATQTTALPRAARNFPGCTVGTSSTVCLAANTAVTFLEFHNPITNTVNVACAVGTTPVLGASNSITLGPGQPANWGPNTGGVPSGALNCIAGAAATPMYLEWN